MPTQARSMAPVFKRSIRLDRQLAHITFLNFLHLEPANLNTTMTNEPDNSLDETQEGMGDDRLDELLSLATPNIERKRQKRILRKTANLLRSTRPGWSSFVSTRSIGLIACVCCVVLLARIGIEIWYAPNTPSVANSSHSGSAVSKSHSNSTVAVAEPNTARHLVATHPQIFSKIATKRSNLSRRNNIRNRNLLSPRSTASRIATWISMQSRRRSSKGLDLRGQLTSGLLSFANSPAGLFTVEQFSLSLDRAIANHPAAYPPSNSLGRRRLAARASQFSSRKTSSDLSGSNRSAPNRSRFNRTRSNHSKSRNAESAKQLQALVSFRQRFEQALIGQLDDPSEAVATTSFRLLCRCGSRQSLSTILDQWNRASLRQDIVHAAKRLADSKTLGQLALSTNNRELQTELMSGLLCRHDSSSLDLFLELTAKHELYVVAQTSGLIANSMTHCMPTEQLLNRLRSNRLAIARAAAITLSEIDDPRIHDHLMRLAQRPESTHSAMMALTARRDAPSIQFVEMVASDRRWSATVDNAKKKWNRLLAIN